MAWNLAHPAGPHRSLYGYSEFAALEVREVSTSDSQRAFAVYDTAKVDDASHADVCQIVSTKKGGRSARSQLRDLANERLKQF